MKFWPVLMCLFGLGISFPSYGQFGEVETSQPTNKPLVMDERTTFGPRGILSFTAGLVLPTGSFASNWFDGTRSGYARNGVSLNVHLNWLIEGHFGIYGAWLTSFVPYDEEAFTSDLSTLTIASLEVEATMYNASTITVGPFASKAYGPWIVEGHMHLGVMLASSPELVITQRLGAQGFRETYEPIENESGFAYGLGGSLKYEMNEQLALTGHIDYIRSEITFQDGRYFNTQGQFGRYRMTRDIHMISCQVGIAVYFLQ